MTKIIFFIDSLCSGGKERRLVELIKGLIKTGKYDIELVLTKRDIHYREILETEIRIHIIERKYIKKDPRLFYKFYKIAKEFAPDIIHVWGNMVAIYAIPAKMMLKVPLINNQITSAPLNVSKSLLNNGLSFRFSDRIISNTKAGLKSFNPPLKKSAVIYNGFDFNRIAHLENTTGVIENFNIKTKYLVAMVASFTEKKDYKTYIDAAANLLSQRHDVTFLCIGSGDSTKFENTISKTDKDHILFLGKQKNVESIMNVCDIGVLITNNEKHGEGISNAILEFAALGKPVVATKGGGNGEIIKDGENGYLIAPGSSDELAGKINYLLENKGVREKFGKQSRLLVENKFSIDKMIMDFENEYEKILM